MLYSKNFIDNTMDKALSADLRTAAYNLSAILGDTNGKLNTTTATLLISRLDIASPGRPVIEIVPQAQSPDWSTRLTLETFIPEVSSRSFDIFNKIKLLDQSLVYVPLTLDIDEFSVRSPLLLYTKSFSRDSRSVAHVLYVELLSIYLEILGLKANGNFSRVSRIDITRIDNNIRWLSNRVESISPPNLDVLKILRDAQRTILFLRSMNRLFIEGYNLSKSKLEGSGM